MKKRLFPLFVLTLFLLAACSSRGGQDFRRDSEVERYYRGTEGIRMLLDAGSPPPRLYYYSDAPTDDYNAFLIDVEVQNVGASWTKGGIYVSGYDPSLIYIEGINIPKSSGGFFDSCRVSIDSLSWDNLAGVLGCNLGGGGVEISGDDNSFTGRINNLLQIFGCDDCPEIDFGINRQTGEWNFDFSAFGLDIDFLHHGRALLLILDNVDFDRFNGEEFFLAPDDHNYPGGESTLVSFPGYIQKTWPRGLDETDVTFLLTSCYAYSTYATPIVCVDPAPFSENEKVCYPGQIDLAGSQGAPVAVSRVLQENTPRSIIFTIEVQNVGRGEVIYPGDLELCSPYYPGRLSVQSLDTVILGDIRMSGSASRLRCTPDSNLIRLRDGRGQITCTYDLEYATAKSAYRAPLLIELWYGYSETMRRNVHIKRVS